MIKNILFDLDDTILDFKKSEALAVAKSFCEMGISYDSSSIERYSVINSMLWRSLEKGEITRQSLLTKRFEILFEEMNVKANALKMKEIYENNLSHGHYFINGALKTIKTLYKNYNLYIVSNGTLKVQQGRLKSANIEQYFKDIFISEQIGFVKPEKEFFDYCFSKIKNFEKESFIIVGDSLSSDIKGGNIAGIKTCWFNPKKLSNNTDSIVDFEIAEIGGLIDVLESV